MPQTSVESRIRSVPLSSFPVGPETTQADSHFWACVDEWWKEENDRVHFFVCGDASPADDAATFNQKLTPGVDLFAIEKKSGEGPWEPVGHFFLSTDPTVLKNLWICETPDRDTLVWFDYILLSKEARGLGIFGNVFQLVKKHIHEVYQRSILALNVFDLNEPARSIYLMMNFKEVGLEEKRVPDGVYCSTLNLKPGDHCTLRYYVLQTHE